MKFRIRIIIKGEVVKTETFSDREKATKFANTELRARMKDGDLLSAGSKNGVYMTTIRRVNKYLDIIAEFEEVCEDCENGVLHTHNGEFVAV